MGAQTGIWSRRFRVVGWLCAAGSVLLTINLLVLLAELPKEWWLDPSAEVVDGQFDIRWMHVDLFLGWFGWWGYVANSVWLPTAIRKGHRAKRGGRRPTRSEAALFLVNVSVPMLISGLVHFTPLQYPTLQCLRALKSWRWLPKVNRGTLG